MALYDKVLLAGVLITAAAVLFTTDTVVMLLEDLSPGVVQTATTWLFRVGVSLAFVGAAAHIVMQLP